MNIAKAERRIKPHQFDILEAAPAVSVSRLPLAAYRIRILHGLSPAMALVVARCAGLRVDEVRQ